MSGRKSPPWSPSEWDYVDRAYWRTLIGLAVALLVIGLVF